MSVPVRYSILIHWSDEDQAYLVTLPEWSHLYRNPTTHGASYEAALANAQEVLAVLIESAMERGEELPVPGRRRSSTVAA